MSSSREGRGPPPPSSFARTPSSSNRSSISPDNRRQSAIFVGKIPLSITPTSTSKDSSSPLHASTASTSSSSSSNRSSSSLQGQDPSNNDDTTTSSSSTFKRPSKSTRRPSLQNGLPSPPFTSSEGSGGSIRLPNQPQPQPPPSSFQQSLHRHNSTSSGQSEEDIDNSLVMDGYDQQQHEQAAATTSRRSSLTSSRREQRGGDQERDQRIKDLKERNVKIIDHLATLSSSSSPSNARYSSDSPATPSPTRSSYRTAPPSSSSNSTSSSTKSTRRSSLPAPPPATSNGRFVKPPLRDDAGWEVSAGEETERAYSSGGGSPSGSGGGGWGERDLQQQRRPNLPRSGFSGSSAEGGPETYRLPPSLASPSHERTSSLGSDGALSRRSSRSGGSRGPGGGPSASLHTQSQSMSSLDPPSPPPSNTTTTNHNPRVARDAPSSLRTTALHRSQSTSTTGSGSSSGRRPALQPHQGSDGSSHSRVVPSPTSNRSRAGSGGPPSSGSLHQTLRISPSVRSTRGSLAGLANSRDTSPSPRSQQPPFSAARSTFASRQAVRSNSQASSLASPFSSPDKELNGRGSTTETVGRRRANGGETSTAGGEQRSDERATRERQTSGGAKRRAPLPMEFRNDGSPPEPAPPAPPPPRNPRITTTAPTLSKRSVDLDRSSPNRASPEFYTASGSSTLTHNTSPRISRVLPPSRSRTIRGNGYDEQDRPRYLRRGGSAESALAEKDGKRGGEENNGRDLFSRENEKSAAVGTREILARIERDTAEREEKKRELLESQALRRAESVMASSEQQERTYQQHQYQQRHDRPESSMSRTEDFNRRFPPRTPTASTTRNSVRHTPQTMAPLRPSTAMSSFMDDAPRTAPPIGQHQLRSHRSIYNIQAAAAREDASPSPSQLLRSRNAINNDLSRAAAGTPTRQSTFDRNQSLRRAATPSSSSPYHPRAMTSIDFPTSTSSHSNFSASTNSGPLENMVKAFAHLEAYYSPLSLNSSDTIIRSANALMSSAESTNTSIAQVLAFTRQQLVDAEVNDMPLDFIDGLNQVSFDLKEAKKTSDEEIRQLVDLMTALPRLGRELGAARGGGGGGSSDGGRDDRMFAGVRSRHSSLEKGGSPSLVGRNESRRSMDFHSREASEPAPSRFADSHYTRPSTSQQTYSSSTTSPSSRFQRDTLQPRPRLPSIPSVRQFVNDARAAADSSSTSTVSAAPFPRTGDSSTSLNSQTLSPPRKRTSVLAHVFDRFSNKQEDPSSSSSSNDKLPSPDRTWRQAKLSSTSTVRATSLFPSGPKVSEPTTAISTVTATHGSPSRTTSGLPSDPDSYLTDENDDSPRPKISATASFLNRARTMSMHPGSGESSPRRGSGDPRRTSFAEDDDTHASGSGSESAERRRRQSLPPAGSMTSTSPSSVLRRLPGIFGGGGGLSPKKKDATGLP